MSGAGPRDLRFSDVAKTFTDERTGGTRQVFDGFSLTVEPGELVAVVGATGTGKSTLLHLAAGLERPDRGKVRTGEGPPPRLGMVFREPWLLDWRSVRRNVEVAVRAARLAQGGVPDVLAAVGLTDHADTFAVALSDEQRRRLAIARAFAVEPELVLLDDPFDGLDELAARRIRLLLQRLWSDRPATGLLVTRNRLEAAFLADRVLELSGRPATVAREYRRDGPAQRDVR